MTPDQIRKFKWFWAWQDQQEEAWLEEMSRQGLHLKSVGIPALYYFEQGLPQDYVYRLDFSSGYKDRANYIQLFEDAGWEHIGYIGFWEYFRKARKPGELVEIYTDKESSMKKYVRVMLFLGIISLPLWLGLRDIPYSGLGGFYLFFRVFMGLLAILYVYAFIRLLLRIQQLKSS